MPGSPPPASLDRVLDIDDTEVDVSAEELREILDQLHGQLDRAAPKSAEERELLEKAACEIRTALDAGDEPSREKHEPLLDRLKDVAKRFEDEHPDLTFAVGRLSDMLGKLGI